MSITPPHTPHRKNTLLIALVQCTSIDANPDLAVENMDQLCQQAHDNNCDLIIFPEMYLSGYNIPLKSLEKLAEPAAGKYAQQIASLAQKYRLHIIFGYPERAKDAIYNSAQFISAHGEILLNYQKTHLFGSYDHCVFSAGSSEPKTANVEGWNIGIQICYDIEFPENARILALVGADLIAVPTANMLPFHTVAEILVPARALENQLYIAYVNYCGSAGDLDFCGHSTVASPQGNIIAQDKGYTACSANIIYSQCDSQLLENSRAQYPYLTDRIPAHYNRLTL